MTHATLTDTPRHDTLTPVTGKSGRGTARQTVRIDEALWVEFEDARARAGAKDRSEVLREFVKWYVRRAGAKLPKRPTEPTQGQET